MRDWILGSITVCLFFFAVLSGFVAGVEFQKTRKMPVQTHIVSMIMRNVTPQSSRQRENPPAVPDLYKKQGHRLQIETDDDTSEFYCMAQNIYFEAGNQSRKGKLAVGQVVMNRVRSGRFPDTVCEVVKQRMQFSWYWDGKHDVPNKTSKTWKDSVEVAKEVLYGDVVQRDDRLNGALHYHADYVNPYWANQKVMIAKIDDHIFYGR
jgi:spore germination cell wall hydrolase CwlJ-like protein